MTARGRSIVLAAGTVDGSGTMVALASALLHLTAVSESRPVTAVLPGEKVGVAGAHNLVTIRVGRGQALVREALGQPAADVYIGFADRLPLRPSANRYDVMVVQNPHLYGPADQWVDQHRAKFELLSRWARRSARQADLVICSTEASRNDVIESTGADPAKVVVRPIPARSVEVTKTDHNDVVSRVLNVSDLYDYKRVDVALDAVVAWAATQDHAIEFVHIGREVDASAAASLAETASRAEAAGVTVTRLGRVDNAQVFDEMIKADVLMLPSAAESQGLPLVEALSTGLPTVCRAISVFTEQGGDHVVAVGSTDQADRAADVVDFAAGLAAVADRDVRQRLSRGGLAAHTPDASGWNLLPEES